MIYNLTIEHQFRITLHDFWILLTFYLPSNHPKMNLTALRIRSMVLVKKCVRCYKSLKVGTVYWQVSNVLSLCVRDL